MTTPVLICDDSGMARKQMARALPEDWDVTLSYAGDGNECLEQLRKGLGEVLFLDLNMPVLDGYGVLEAVRNEDLPTVIIVVSGDIQPEAYKRVMVLGALAFVKKPTNIEELNQVLVDFGLYRPGENTGAVAHSPQSQPEAIATSWLDALQEISNVAMGQAGDLLARLLDVFVELPIPRVNHLEASELRMALTEAGEGDCWSAICQGFIGSGINGEGLLLFSDSRIDDMAKLLGYVEDEACNRDLEVLVDMTSILTGAFLRGFGEQLDVHFSISHPTVLGTHVAIKDLLEKNSQTWERMLAIELNYNIEHHDIQCDLLLLLTDDSAAALQEKLEFIMD